MYLNCKTYFSYRYGTFSAAQLVQEGSNAGATALALTNINNTTDVWPFVTYCRGAGIKPIAGTEIRNEDTLCYILLARNNVGLAEINFFLSEHLVAKKAFPKHAVFTENVAVIYPFGKELPAQLNVNEYIGIQITEINFLYGKDLKAYHNRLVIRQPVTFEKKKHYNLHRLLRAIDKNIILSKQHDLHKAGLHEYYMPIGQLMEAFRQYPHIISNTFQLMDACSVEMNYRTDKNKKFFTSSKEDDYALLEKLAMDGLNYRYQRNHPTARERVLKELKIIYQLNFCAYFLITWDFLQYAKARSFYHVGRGSGANSVVAYCLKITDVDPIELDLYFERFLNPQRTSPPDFDIDFSWQDRDEMIDYIFKRYGRDHVALLGMYSTFQFSAAVRELGKVFGLPKSEIDVLAEGRFIETDKTHMQILKYSRMMQDMPNHLSIHAGGMLISEEPIHNYTAVELPPKSFRVTQIDMRVAEDVGLFKFDILSQRGLGHIKDAIELVKKNRNIDIDIQQIEKFKTDPNLAANIRVGNTIGCFYIESPSMRQLLKKLRCDDYLRLVAASSIIRPGVGQSGMMQQYIFRYHHPDKFEYLHPIMKELLEETYGVMVYQEDVIKVGHFFGGLDLSEADVLRRAMSGKYRGNAEMMRLEAAFFHNCQERNYPENITKEVWRQIASFAGYSFSKAHSASFAVESYQSLYLKTYFPVEFLVAVINNFGGFYSREIYFQQLARTGVEIEAVCVNHSEYLTSIHEEKVYVGFVHLKSLEVAIVERLVYERKKNGNYLHLQNLIERTSITEEQLKIIIKAGGLRFTGQQKRELLWEASFLCRPKEKHSPAKNALFEEEPFEFKLPQLAQTPLEHQLQELELMGFQLGNIFDLVDDDTSRYPLAVELKDKLGMNVTCLGYLVTTKDTQTKKDKLKMHFGVWLDVSGDWLDTVHFPKSAATYPFRGRGFYRFSGKVICEFEVYSIAVEFMEKVGIKEIQN